MLYGFYMMHVYIFTTYVYILIKIAVSCLTIMHA